VSTQVLGRGRDRGGAPPTIHDAEARRTERGVGIIASAAGVLVFLVLLLFAAQLIFNLYATSVVNAAGMDAARQVASGEVDHADSQAVDEAMASAEARARSLLGEYGDHVRFTWTVDDERVSLRLQVERTKILPTAVASGVGLDEIDRTVTVRTERFR
jgi:hypothetical protein